MIVRERSPELNVPKAVREPEKKRLGRRLSHSELCDNIWNASLGIRSKDDLESAIRKSDITILPDSIPDDIVSVAVRHGGQFSTEREYINHRGVAYFSVMMRAYRGKLEAVFKELRSA